MQSVNPAWATENDLIQRLRLGDAKAFEAVMRQNNRRLYRLARSILGNDQDAEDAVQDTYIRGFARIDSFLGQSSLTTWLSSIALNEARERLRRRRDVAGLADIAETELNEAMRQNTSVPLENPEDQASRAELRHLLERAIDDLPPNFRSVFVLRAVEQMSVHDAATSLDIPEETVRTRFHRARALLRHSLGKAIQNTLGDVFAFDGARCDRIVAAVLLQLEPRSKSG